MSSSKPKDEFSWLDNRFSNPIGTLNANFWDKLQPTVQQSRIQKQSKEDEFSWIPSTPEEPFDPRALIANQPVVTVTRPMATRPNTDKKQSTQSNYYVDTSGRRYDSLPPPLSTNPPDGKLVKGTVGMVIRHPQTLEWLMRNPEDFTYDCGSTSGDFGFDD